MKNTKIVCTLGPMSESKSMIQKLVHAGMNVVRLNFSHGTYEEFKTNIQNVRSISKQLGLPLAIIQDLQGPKIRTGELPAQGKTVLKNDKITLTIQKKNYLQKIPVQYKKLPRDVKKGDIILIDDGMIELKVLSTTPTDIECLVLNNGVIKTHKGINVPTGSISASPLTPKDLKDLSFGLEQKVDYIALSFVRSAKDIHQLRKLINKQKSQAKIIAKIERHEALKNLEDIIKASDAIMVARGDLGVEIAPEQVPLIQKKMIHLANKHGKPVITATQILQSMVENPRPTRAEVSDAANAILDGSDALMLSNETAVGKYPIEAVEVLTHVAKSIEPEMKKNHDALMQNGHHKHQNPAIAICENAAMLAKEIDARWIITLTLSGFTAIQASTYRSGVPIIAITEDPKIYQQLSLVNSIQKVFTKNISINNPIEQTKTFLQNQKLVQEGDRVVIISNASNEEKVIATIKF